MYRWQSNFRSTVVILLLGCFHFNILAQESTEPPEIVCGLDLNGNGSFAEEGETTFCEPTTTVNQYSCPLGRVNCESIDIPVSSCLPRITHIQNLEQEAYDIAEAAAVEAEAKAAEATKIYDDLLLEANRLKDIAIADQVLADTAKAAYEKDILEGNDATDSRVAWLAAQALADSSLLDANNAMTAANDQLTANQPILEAAITAREAADEAAKFTTSFPSYYQRQVTCPSTNVLFTAPYNPTLEDLAIRDRSCALSCDGDASVIDRTVWTSPIDGGACVNLLDPSYIDAVTGVIDFEAALQAPLNMVDSPSECFVKQQEFLDVSEDYYEDNETVDPQTGECNGEFQIFSGKVTGCRSNGYQTRWDNCCNNGDKIITDSFSEKTVAEEVESVANMIGGAFDTVTGTGLGSDIAKLFKSKFVKLPFGVDPLATVGKIGNWLLTPCSKESESVSKMASDMCIYVGEKCVEKWFGIGCVQHAQVHCCFKTKLAKLFHEQARSQLPNFGWGNAQDANCRGFTPEEFQAIDFSKVNLSEYVPEIQNKPVSDIQTDMTNGVPNITLPNSGGG